MIGRVSNRVVLSRYERSPEGLYYLDVAAGTISDLYNSYDKSAPFVRRDLDQDLVTYLIECCRELRSVPFEIRLTLVDGANEESINRISQSIASYFAYLIEKERQDMSRGYRRSLVLVIVGLAILFGSVILRRAIASGVSVLSSVFSEGLSILAWVSIWEASALFILDLIPFRRRIRTYTKLSAAKVSVRTELSPAPQSSG